MIEFAAVTDTGNRYQHNEDAMGWDIDVGVWLVADGMGGHARGDVASETVRESLLGALAHTEGATAPASTPASGLASPLPLQELILTAHDAVIAEASARGFHNMGSTVVVARVDGRSVEIGWCGDSRAYLSRDGELLRLTADHSLLEQLLRSGVVQPEEAFGHPQKHVLVQALGINEPRPIPTVLRFEMMAGDRLLLCSDGVHDELRDEQIQAVLAAETDPQACVDRLRELVLAGTARDNLSAVCLTDPDLPDNPAVESFADLSLRLAPPRPSIEGRLSKSVPKQAELKQSGTKQSSQEDTVKPTSGRSQPMTGNTEFDRQVARRRANVKAAIAAKGRRASGIEDDPGDHQPAAAQIEKTRSDTSEMATSALMDVESNAAAAAVAEPESPRLEQSAANEPAPAGPVADVTPTSLWARDGAWSALVLLAMAGLLASYFPWLFN